jgi:hypothetical protein
MRTISFSGVLASPGVPGKAGHHEHLKLLQVELQIRGGEKFGI